MYSWNQDPPAEHLAEFLSLFEEDGVSPVVIYGRTSSAQHWRFDFPGCRPNECVSKKNPSEIELVNWEIFNQYYRKSPTEWFELDRRVVEGMEYVVGGLIQYNDFYEIMYYIVTVYRDPVGLSERLLSYQYNFEGKMPIYRYYNYLSIGVDYETTDIPPLERSMINARENGY
ncbi:hypothetical protein FHS89_001365 [Rubricella aquisinus]|uniref:Uncharacterized protein n=1 Tax=Rubricella aquisinus TaxID=2028108 RepID=A0A840WMM2_9RHOB|nr:hypothetical protein [Rubricella aquisinus]MBB5515353.1 hypothetical protein [Rubricella aquisinus]